MNSGTFKIENYTPFGVCYSKVNPTQVENYEMVIIEPDFYSVDEIKELKESGPQIIGYVSLGEVDKNRKYFPLLESFSFLGKNDNWNSYFLNLEIPEVRQLILNKVITEIIAKGVDGLFLDTVDAVSPGTDRDYLQPYMAQLIEDIRANYPEIIIIQNAGLFLLDRTKDDVDAFFTEAMASDYEFSSNEYLLRPDREFKERLSYLKSIQEKTSTPFFILDFAAYDKQYDQVKARLDTVGQPYFISTISLSSLPSNTDSVANNLKPLNLP